MFSSTSGLVEQLLEHDFTWHSFAAKERKKEVPSCFAGRLKHFFSFFFFSNDLFESWPNIEYFGLKTKSFNENCNREKAKIEIAFCLYPCCCHTDCILCILLPRKVKLEECFSAARC